jgi:hypothetical protein
MNIKDLPAGSYKIVQPGTMNIKNLPTGSYKVVSNASSTSPFNPKSPNSQFVDPKAKQTGTGVLSQIPSVIANGAASYAKNVGSAFMGSAKTIVDNTKQVFSGKKNPKDALMQNAGEVAKSVFTPINEAIKPAIKAGAEALSNNKTFSKAANSKAGDVISNSANRVGSFYSQWSEQHPEAARNLEAGINIGQLLLSAEPVNTAGDLVSKTAKSGLDTVKTTVGDIGGKVSDNLTARSTANLESQTIRDATPGYSKKLISDSGIKNSDGTITPRVSEGGPLKARTVNPTPLEIDAGKALTKVKNYPTKGTALEKYQAVQPEITRQSQTLFKSLEQEKILRPPQQIVKVVSDAVNSVPEKSLLLQKSDPIIANYMRVIKNAIGQNDGTLAGELKVRQAMDAAYENARGKLAFGSDKISALDEVHRAGRNALNEDIINYAQSTDVKASLKSQWDLLRASDVLRDKAEAEAGTSLGRFAQKHPMINRIGRGMVKTGANAAGIGAVVH